MFADTAAVEKYQQLNKVVDQINGRYGGDTLRRARKLTGWDKNGELSQGVIASMNYRIKEEPAWKKTELIQRSQQGDLDAFEQLLLRYEKKGLHHCI